MKTVRPTFPTTPKPQKTIFSPTSTSYRKRKRKEAPVPDRIRATWLGHAVSVVEMSSRTAPDSRRLCRASWCNSAVPLTLTRLTTSTSSSTLCSVDEHRLTRGLGEQVTLKRPVIKGILTRLYLPDLGDAWLCRALRMPCLRCMQFVSRITSKDRQSGKTSAAADEVCHMKL